MSIFYVSFFYSKQCCYHYRYYFYYINNIKYKFIIYIRTFNIDAIYYIFFFKVEKIMILSHFFIGIILLHHLQHSKVFTSNFHHLKNIHLRLTKTDHEFQYHLYIDHVPMK